MTISPINLGNSFTTGSGSSALSGLSSGLNTQSVINSLVASQSAQIGTFNDKITVNNKQLTALSTLQQLLTQIQTAVGQLSNPQSPNSSSNVFANSSAQVTSNTTQAASNFLNATAAADTPAGTYTISNISQLATATTQLSSAFSVSPASTPLVVASGAVAGQFNAGTFTIDGPNGSGSVTFTAGDSLNQIASDFNAANSNTGLTATVQKSSTGSYSLAFTNTTTGAAVNFDPNNTSDLTSDPSGVFSAQAGSSTITLSAASNPVVVASGAGSSQFNAGTYTIAGPSGSGTVTLNVGDNIDEVANDFNLASSKTGIKANVLQTSPGIYQIEFASTTTGQDTNFDLGNGNATPSVTNGSGTPESLGGVTFTNPTAAGTAGQDATFQLNGVTITRPTNTVSDLISGVTFNLLQNTTGQAGASFTLTVSPDTSSIQTAITNFASAYNNFLTFYAQQTALNSAGTPASSAILYSDSTLRNIYNQLSTQVASIVTGTSSGSGSANQLADIGLSFFNSAASSTSPAVSNAISVDDTALDAAITNNLSGVENVFGYNLTSSSPNLTSFQPATNSNITNFTLNVSQSPSPATYTATLPNGTQVALTASALGSGGVSLTAPTSSELAGLILIYTGTGNELNIKVSTSYGIASQINTFVTGALTANTGLLATDESTLTTSNTTLQTQITNVTAQVSAQRTELLQKFSALEAAISQANSSLDYLNAQQAAASSGG